jgi:hypothetical protein
MVPTDTPSAAPLHADTPEGQGLCPCAVPPELPPIGEPLTRPLLPALLPLTPKEVAPLTPLPSPQAASPISSAAITPILAIKYVIPAP